MFVSHIDPVLFHLGPLEIRYYGIIYALAFLLGYWYVSYRAKKAGWLWDVDKLFVYLIVGDLVGARLFEVLFYHPGFYFAHPLQIVFFWQGGLSFHGGLVGGLVAVWLFCKKFKVDWLVLADILVIPLAFGFFLGRIANFLNGELFGFPSSLPWAVDFGDGVFRHPTQLYESLAGLFIFFLLWSLQRRKKVVPRGFFFAVFLLWYGLLRFFLEFLKVPEQTFVGMPVGQWFSVLMVVVGVFFFIKLKKGHKVVMP